jgi:hypothetical protein
VTCRESNTHVNIGLAQILRADTAFGFVKVSALNVHHKAELGENDSLYLQLAYP